MCGEMDFQSGFGVIAFRANVAGKGSNVLVVETFDVIDEISFVVVPGISRNFLRFKYKI